MKNSILKFLEPRGLYNNASNKQEKFDWKLKSGSGPTRFNSFYNYRHKRDKIANLAKNKMKLHWTTRGSFVSTGEVEVTRMKEEPVS